ncbi:hypothetical protein NHX12_010029 [Muraenolepis orangiensis]|uniref:Major facilitator superfamily (MFS) profile domain-containing protein n=1 Tax=Muraenolepis orangiensis TaxID=630683 RepID=A0A9Q0I6X0_9TELE|nr:hypothetical protein NHX12_010029 [Muraenolepis orangiensis]
MGRLYLIQPVVGIYGFCFFMCIPLLQQYVYARLWERLSSAPYSSSQSTHCANSSSNLTLTYKEVQKEASLFILYVELSVLLPSMFSSPLLVSCSDSRGRKVAMVPPLLGNLFFSLCCLLISCFSLDLRLLLGAGFLMGLLGGPAALLGASFAYVADRCREAGPRGTEGGAGGPGEVTEVRQSPSRHRTVSMASVELALGLISGVAPACTGVFIHTIGFSWPFLIASVLHLLNLAYVLLVLQDSLVPEVLGQLQSVYTMFQKGSRKRNTALGLILATFALFKMCKDGGMSIIILYQLNQPLCWTELLIGYSALLGVVIHLGSYAGVSLWSRCLEDSSVVLIGLLSLAAVRVPLILSEMPNSILRSMMSHLVPSSEQGAVFACVVFLEMVSVFVALVLFNTTYAATVSWFPGFSFLLASLLTVLPALLMG